MIIIKHHLHNDASGSPTHTLLGNLARRSDVPLHAKHPFYSFTTGTCPSFSLVIMMMMMITMMVMITMMAMIIMMLIVSLRFKKGQVQ